LNSGNSGNVLEAEAIVEKAAITEDTLRQLLSPVRQEYAEINLKSNNHSISDKTALKYGRMLVAKITYPLFYIVFELHYSVGF
jgi:hypothetical protein